MGFEGWVEVYQGDQGRKSVLGVVPCTESERNGRTVLEIIQSSEVQPHMLAQRWGEGPGRGENRDGSWYSQKRRVQGECCFSTNAALLFCAMVLSGGAEGREREQCGGRASSVAHRGWTWSFCSQIAAPPLFCDLGQAACSFLGLIFTTGEVIPGPFSMRLPDSELVCVGKAFRLPPDQR